MNETKQNEKEPLLINKDFTKTGNIENSDSTPNKLFALNFIVTFFMCALEMSTMTVSQFVYRRLQEQSTNTTQPFQQDKTNQTACQLNGSTSENDIQKEASEWLWYIGLVELGLSLIVIVFLGIYSDFVGRKPLILVSIIGNVFKNGMIAAIIYFNLDILYLFIAYVFGGIGGAHYTFHIGYLASVADTTKSNNDRSFGVALLDLLLGIGISTSQIATGYLIQILGFLYPVVICFALCVICGFIVIVCVGETNRKMESKMFSFTSGFQNFTGFYRDSSYIKGNPIWKFILCLFGFILIIAPLAANTNIQTLFLLRSPFCFLSESVGWFGSVSYFTKLVIGTILIKLFHCCLKDETIAFFGCLSATAYFGVLGFCSSTFMLYIAVGVGMLSILPLAMFRALVSKMVVEHRQGALFANVLVLEVLSKLAASSAFNNLYAVTQDVMTGLTFLVMAGICFVAAITVIPLLVSGVRREFEYSEDV